MVLNRLNLILILAACWFMGCASTPPPKKVGYTCASGNMSVCVKQGEKFYNSKEYTKAKVYFQRACDNAKDAGCEWMAHLYMNGLGVKKDLNKAEQVFEPLCKKKNGWGCMRQGRVALKRKEFKRMYALYTKSCTLKYALGCHTLAQAYANGEGLEIFQRTKSVMYHKKACALGHQNSCTYVALARIEGKGTKQNIKTGLKSLYQGCAKNHGWSCHVAGWVHNNARFDAKDTYLAKRFYQKACTLNYGLSCGTRGIISEKEKNFAEMFKWYEKGCQLKTPNACRYLANVNWHGTGLKQPNFSKAYQHYELACTYGSRQSCHYKAQFTVEGIGRRQNVAMGRKKIQTMCKEGFGQSCALLAKWSLSGDYLPENRDKAYEYYEKACKLKHAQSCMDISWFYNRKKTELAKKQAYLYSKKACTYEHNSACMTALMYQIQGEGTPQNVQAGIKGLEALCEKKDVYACLALGGLYKRGKYVKKDESRTLKLYESTCKLDVPRAQRGCAYLAQSYAEADGAPFDLPQGIKRYRQACKKENMYSCINLGVLHDMGRGLPKNEKKAVSLYKKACDAQVLHGCANYYSAMIHGEGIAQNKEEGFKQLIHLCKINMMSSCYRLGLFYRRGKHISKDLPKAYKLIDRACSDLSRYACHVKAVMLRDGESVKKDVKQANKLFEQECAKNHGWSCQALGEFYKEHDLAKAKTYYKRAHKAFKKKCDILYPYFCKAMKKLPAEMLTP